MEQTTRFGLATTTLARWDSDTLSAAAICPADSRMLLSSRVDTIATRFGSARKTALSMSSGLAAKKTVACSASEPASDNRNTVDIAIPRPYAVFRYEYTVFVAAVKERDYRC